MRKGSGTVAVLGALMAIAVPASRAHAQGVTAPEVVLGAHLYPKPYGLTYVYGRLRVPDGTPASAVANQKVDLSAPVFPFNAWAVVATLTTDWEGYFSYHQTVAQNTDFDAIWHNGAADVHSKDRMVELPLRVSLRVSAGRGRRVTFKGSSFPPHPGARIYVQQMDRHGRFRTVTSTRTAASSKFARPWRLRRPGVFRALFPGDGQFEASASRPVRVRKH